MQTSHLNTELGTELVTIKKSFDDDDDDDCYHKTQQGLAAQGKLLCWQYMPATFWVTFYAITFIQVFMQFKFNHIRGVQVVFNSRVIVFCPRIPHTV